MENEVLRDILLILSVIVTFVVGFFIMKRLDVFLEKNYKSYIKKDKKPKSKVCRENLSDEEILSEIKKIRKNHERVKIVISDDLDDIDLY